MSEASRFVLFGPAHLMLLCLLAVLGAGIVLPARRWGMPWRGEIAAAFGVYILAQEALDRGWRFFANGEPWQDILPLNLCGASVVLTGAMLILRSYRLYELLYFWALGGAGVAVFTPDIAYGYTHLLYWTFFLSHACTIYGVAYMTACYGFRPQPRSLLRAAVGLHLFALPVLAINLLLDTNYLYLREKPAGETLMNALGPWPWYVAAVDAIALGVFAALYLPFAAADWRADARRRAKAPAAA